MYRSAAVILCVLVAFGTAEANQTKEASEAPNTRQHGYEIEYQPDQADLYPSNYYPVGNYPPQQQPIIVQQAYPHQLGPPQPQPIIVQPPVSQQVYQPRQEQNHHYFHQPVAPNPPPPANSMLSMMMMLMMLKDGGLSGLLGSKHPEPKKRKPTYHAPYKTDVLAPYKPHGSAPYKPDGLAPYKPDGSAPYKTDDSAYYKPDDSAHYKPDGLATYKTDGLHGLHRPKHPIKRKPTHHAPLLIVKHIHSSVSTPFDFSSWYTATNGCRYKYFADSDGIGSSNYVVAEQYCKNLQGAGARLASTGLRSDEVKTELIAIFPDTVMDEVWIGLDSREHETGIGTTWVWSDGVGAPNDDSTMWESGTTPDGSNECAVLTSSSDFKDKACASTSDGFLCESCVMKYVWN